MITKEEFERYESVKCSGVTNMFDVKTVMVLSELSREVIMDIMKNYSDYYKKFNGDKQ